jgi:hypothetical protein
LPAAALWPGSQTPATTPGVTRAAAIAVLLLLAATGPVRAHNLGAKAVLRGDHVEVEAYYSDDTPARDARVVVHDNADKLIADGRTDDAGRWQFPAPPPGRYVVVVDAGSGHRKRLVVTIPGTAADGESVSEGPSRAEFTRFPWGGIAAGLTVIVLLAVGWRAWRRWPPQSGQ